MLFDETYRKISNAPEADGVPTTSSGFLTNKFDRFQET